MSSLLEAGAHVLQERSAIIATLKAHSALVTAMQRYLDLRADKDGSDESRAAILHKVTYLCMLSQSYIVVTADHHKHTQDISDLSSTDHLSRASLGHGAIRA